MLLAHRLLHFPLLLDGSHLYRQTLSGQSRAYLVTKLRTDGFQCRESHGTGPVDLKVVRVTGDPLSGITAGTGPVGLKLVRVTGAVLLSIVSPRTNLCASLLTHPLKYFRLL